MMKSKLLPALPPIVLGSLIAFGPQTFACPCPIHGDHPMPMVCHWTAQASLAVGLTIVMFGVVAFFVDARMRAGLSIAVAVNAIAELAIVLWLIGVCENPMMHCTSVMKPTLVVCSVLALVFAAVAAFVDMKKN